MRFDPAFLDEIRQRITLSELIGRAVALKRAGREFRGLSPFKTEKTPSFFVNDEKRRWFDFSAQKNGDAFTWMIEHEGLSFPEAVERLAGEAGVPMPAQDPKGAERARDRKTLVGWMEEASRHFRAELLRTRGAEARAYLERRGLSADDWETFEIGYAPEAWTNLKEELEQRGASTEELLRCGLLSTSDKADRPFDAFRDRIMFPIRDAQGRLVAFGGRMLKKGEGAKYKNSAETEIYHKSSVLYRYPEARKALAGMRGPEAPRGLIVVEGYMDAIALARAGFPHAVAALGTALTEEQMELLWRAGPEPVLCFDGDSAGVAAARRAVERALPHLGPDKTFRVVLMPPGRDPDDLLREEGADAVAAALSKTQPLIDILWDKEVAAERVETLEDKEKLKRRLFIAAKSIPDEGLAESYKRELLDRFDKAFGFKARRKGERPAQGRPRPGYKPGPTPSALARRTGRTRRRLADQFSRLLVAAADRPDLLSDCVEELAALDAPTEDLARLRDAVVACFTEAEDIDKSSFQSHLARLGVNDVYNRARGETRDGQWVRHRPVFESDATHEAAVAAWRAEADLYARWNAETDEVEQFSEAVKASAEKEDPSSLRRFSAAVTEAKSANRQPPEADKTPDGPGGRFASVMAETATTSKRRGRKK